MKSFAHLLTVAALLCVVAPAAHGGVFAHYDFDSDFTDDSGNARHGTLVDNGTTGNSGVTTTAGQHVFGGGALNLATDRDYIDLTSVTFGTGNDYSIGFWAKKAPTTSGDSADWDMVIGERDNTIFFIAPNSSAEYLRWRGNTGAGGDRQTDGAYPASFDDEQWHQYTVVATTGGALNIYIDGALAAGSETGVSTGFIYDTIGEAYTSGNGFDFYGQIDEVWVFDNALSADGVASIYADNLAPVVLTASNGGGTSSFSSALSWSDGAAPSADHNYFTEDNDLRTPEASSDVTFAGNSLSIDTGGRFILKATGGNTVTVDDLRLNGGQIFNGVGGATYTLDGNITANAGTTSTFETAGAGRTIIVDAPIGGSGNIATASAGLLVFNGVNTYTGDTTVTSSTLNLTSSNEQRFLIQNADVSNTIGGTGSIDLDGLLRLDTSVLTDLTGTWNLIAVDTLNESWGSNFGLAFLGGPAFADVGSGVYASGRWSFDQSTGTLTLIPTPAALPAGLALMLAVAARRRRRA